MAWFPLALTCAFFSATSSCLSKMAMRYSDEYVVGWARVIIAVPFFLTALIFRPASLPDIEFFKTIAVLLPFDLAAYFLYMKAIKKSPLSLTVPFMALTPLFSIFTGILVLNETPTVLGTAGILLIVSGAYFLNIDRFNMGVTEPVKAVFRERGSRYMVMVAFLFSITSVLGKRAILHSGPILFPAIYFPLFSLAFLPFLWYRVRKKRLKFTGHGRSLLLLFAVGITFALVIITHMISISMTDAAYMIAIKRMSVIFGVIYGGVVFKEDRIAARIAAAAVMIAGAVCIVLN